MKEFIFFGCWNKGFCDDNRRNNSMSAVFNTIKQNKEQPDFYIIAGDNYYPKKLTEKNQGQKVKIKTLEQNNLLSGFNCLERLQKPVHVLLGNHDVEPIREFKNIPNVSCIVTKLQLEYMNMRPKRFNYKHLYQQLGSTLIVYLNTTYFTEDWIKFVECNRLITHSGGSNKTKKKKKEKLKYSHKTRLEDEMRRYKQALSRINPRSIKHIILTGHDPIWGSKNKGKSTDEFTPLLEAGIHFMMDIYGLFALAKKYYLCADTHFYQMGGIVLSRNKRYLGGGSPSRSSMPSLYSKSLKTATQRIYSPRRQTMKSRTHSQLISQSSKNTPLEIYNITQFIVGTGGASLDQCPKYEENMHRYKSMENLSIEFNTSRYDCQSTHGYLKVKVTNKNLEFQFIPVISSELKGFASPS